jgi:uncharacterized XkdX family phage protein
MYQFIKNMWILGKVTEQQVQNYVAKGFITNEEADQIIGTSRH